MQRDVNKKVLVHLQSKTTKSAVHAGITQQAVSRVTWEHCSSFFNFTAVLPSALLPIPTVTPWDVTPFPRDYRECGTHDRGFPAVPITVQTSTLWHIGDYRSKSGRTPQLLPAVLECFSTVTARWRCQAFILTGRHIYNRRAWFSSSIT